VLWKLQIVVAEHTREAFEAALAETLGEQAVIAAVELREGIDWRIEAFAEELPEPELIARVLDVVAQAFALPAPEPLIEAVADRDWVAENQRSFLPFTVGRFFIYPSFHRGKVPRDLVGIQIDPGMAFGTGTHATTQGCLMAIDEIARSHPIGQAIDVGCGSGILAIALAHAARKRVIACDNDAVAVRVTEENARLNGVANRIVAVRAEGLDHVEIARCAPFQVIVANILAQPLIDLAPRLVRGLLPGGHIVLSGLLAKQGEAVADAYRAEGVSLAKRIEAGDWVTLMMRG
jgi:ribosomal protein L11 methyltransferase